MPPEVGASVSPQDWHDKFLPAQLFGKLFNFCGELSESKNIQGDIFKQIVEGGEITAQHKNQQPFKFHPQCAHWFASNHAPKTKDTSDGFNRRWLFLQFERRIAKENQIIDIDQVILEHEREAIAAWAVLGMIRLVQNKEYTLPASHLSQVDEVSNANNSARYFLSASPRLRVGRQRHEGMSKTSITATDLHGDYWSFCIGTGAAQRAGLVHFMRMMKELAGSFDFNVKTREGRHGEILTEYEYITRVV